MDVFTLFFNVYYICVVGNTDRRLEKWTRESNPHREQRVT